MKGRQITKGRNPWVLAGMAVGSGLLRHGALLVARKVPKGTSEGKDGANETPHNKKTAQRHNKTMIN